MSIRLAKTAGFCWGVKRAVNLALRTAHERSQPIQTFGPLIHNRQALDLLRTKGIDQLPDDADASGCGPVLIRAHGVPPALENGLVERGFEVINATCPHVGRAQRIVDRESRRGHRILIVGDKGHAEVVGLLGYASGRGLVVECPEDVASLPDDLGGRICVVAQTTQGGDRFERCVEAIRNRFGDDVEVFNTRCNDTNNRQEELFELADQVEAIVVVGGRGSANTCRLADLARERGVPTWHVETADELPFDALDRFDEIGVTAGASTPHWIIEQVVDRLRAMQRRHLPLAVRTLLATARLLIIGQIVLALGAAALALAAAHFMQLAFRVEYLILPFLYLLAMHLLHYWATVPRDVSLASGLRRTLATHRRLVLAAAVVSLVGAVVLSALMGPWVFGLVAFSTLMGALYSFGRLPGTFRFRHPHEVPGSKDLCSAAAWAVMVVVVPWVHARGIAQWDWDDLLRLTLAGLFVFGMSLVRSLAADVREIEGDIVLGRETLPIVIGRRSTHLLLTVVLIGLGTLAVILGVFGNTIPDVLIFLMPVLLMVLAYWLTYRQKIRSHLLWALLLDVPFLAAGLLTLATIVPFGKLGAVITTVRLNFFESDVKSGISMS
jgi:4-hydroxy-3-methylbut-2-enyl diphosphate reductase